MGNLGKYQGIVTDAHNAGGVENLINMIERAAVAKSAPKWLGLGVVVGALATASAGYTWNRKRVGETLASNAQDQLKATIEGSVPTVSDDLRDGRGHARPIGDPDDLWPRTAATFKCSKCSTADSRAQAMSERFTRRRRLMSRFTGDPDEAEADLSRASQSLQRAEEELALAEERRDDLYKEAFDGSPETETDLSRRMNAVDREIASLQGVVADAETSFFDTVGRWKDEGFIS